MSDELLRKIKYKFKNADLFKLALTHRSASDENNERLEFLGDSIVNFIIAEALFSQFPFAQEGELSRLRATLINRDTLANMAREFDVGQYLHLGPGEMKSGGSARQSILSCAMESIVGAIYLDGGFAAVRDCILRWYSPLLNSLSDESVLKDPKTTLQEYLQQAHMMLPVYTVEAMRGEAHQQIFIVECFVENLNKKTKGRGTSRRRAEQDAAEMMLKEIKK